VSAQAALEGRLDGGRVVHALEHLAQSAFRDVGGYARGFDGSAHAARAVPADANGCPRDGGGGTGIVEGALGAQACQGTVYLVVGMGPACQAGAQLRLGQLAAGEQTQAVEIGVSQIA
jgi:hypothetical protein